ncbi:UDP-glucose/GDP-mannose dehydrogenase family protein [Paenibacillus sp. sptzw28]|uniref:UDP-glucose dehydrogenase family protein n=1 Tax=Paenibacillus sp. sptzw28 TaxID=715179 RepID=UPI001C6EA702|nr:UDP-glucose/GDP-mannose dehydrogenase family protein [Paenibacillus sp. sptzw28]QYR20615.1 UDP-glucose/GDP-mannose dehydrogenase family protein [Paenibacillus sp. sptzw28]
MKIAVIGTGYVGLVSGVCFSELGNQVICVDKMEHKIEMLRNGEVPIYEPGLQDLLVKNASEGRLSFTTDLLDAVQQSDIIIIAVGTPSLPNGEANLSFIEQVAHDIAQSMNGYKIVVTKSTVPVGTNHRIKQLISKLTNHPFDIVSVPEFLREGSAIKDTFNPDRVVIGTECEAAAERIAELHRPLSDKIVVTDIRSAEMIKYASNAFLATKISFINEIANICEKVGADVTNVAEGMGFDHRIGHSFLKAGIGYGGSCFPKDTQALIQIAGNVDYEFKLLKSVVDVNRDQRFSIISKLETIFGSFSNRTIAIWGLAFKPNTDDVRDAPAIEIIHELVQRGAKIRAYDPIATANFRQWVDHASITWCEDALQAASGADALCLLTEWPEFEQVELSLLQSIMNQPVLIDGRNVFTEEKLASTDFIYSSIGRPNMNRGEILRTALPL